MRGRGAPPPASAGAPVASAATTPPKPVVDPAAAVLAADGQSGDARVRDLATACSAKEAPACARLGDSRIDSDAARATVHYRRACGLGDRSGCFGWGYVLGGDTGAVPQDLPRARELFAQACDAGHTNACSMLGLQYYWGHGVEADRPRAVPYLDPRREGFATTSRGARGPPGTEAHHGGTEADQI